MLALAKQVPRWLVGVHQRGLRPSVCLRLPLSAAVLCAAASPGHGGHGEQPVAAARPGGVEGAAHRRAAALGHAAAGHGGGRRLHAGRQPAEGGHHPGDGREHP